LNGTIQFAWVSLPLICLALEHRSTPWSPRLEGKKRDRDPYGQSGNRKHFPSGFSRKLRTSSGDVALKPRRSELPDDHDTGQLCIIPSDLRFNDTKVTFLEPHGWSVWKASDKVQVLPPNMCKITRSTASSNSIPGLVVGSRSERLLHQIPPSWSMSTLRRGNLSIERPVVRKDRRGSSLLVEFSPGAVST
jgi:hypothetical protein